MRNRVQNDLAIFQLTLAGCFAGAYFGGKYGFSELANRADAAVIGLLIGALIALIFYAVVALLVNTPRRK